MAKITRVTQKQFALNAGFEELSVFGSLAAGSSAYSTNVATIQSLSEFTAGWFSAVVGENSPAIEDMNSLFYVICTQLAYLFQAGIAEYDAGTTYYTGSLVMVSGKIYRSLTDLNIGNDPATSANWAAPITPGLFSPVSMAVNTTVNSGYSLNWSILDVAGGVTYTVSSGGYGTGTLLLVDGTVLCSGTLIY